jgi:hypothetical protein
MQGWAHVLADFFTGDFSTMTTIAILIDVVGGATRARTAKRAEVRA